LVLPPPQPALEPAPPLLAVGNRNGIEETRRDVAEVGVHAKRLARSQLLPISDRVPGADQELDERLTPCSQLNM